MNGAEKRYKVNERFMSWIGVWPDQSPVQRFLFSANAVLAVTSQTYMQTRGMIAAWKTGDWDLVIECSSPIVIAIICMVKLINCLLNFEKISHLLNHMRGDWNTLKMDAQIDILNNYTEKARKLTNTYAGIMYGSMLMYMTLPHAPYFLAWITNANETVPRGLLYHVEVVIDVDKYYYPVLLHSYYATFLLMTLPVAADPMFIVFIYHACGMFAATGYAMEHVIKSNDIDVDINISATDDPVYAEIKDVIEKHQNILQYIELLSSAYTTSLLVLTGFNVVAMTFSGVQAVMYLDKSEEAIRFAATAICLSCHFLFLSLPGQKLIDSSGGFYNSISACNWYALSIQGRKLMNMMLSRSRQPCQIWAGKLCVMSLETFSSVIQASMSYFTVLTSVR